MSLFLDRQFAPRLSTKLDRFKFEGHDVWNFRCPICGDSKRSKTKARGYFYPYPKADMIMMNCKNCSYSAPFGVFLKQFDPSLYKEYVFEQIKFKEEQSPKEEIVEQEPNAVVILDPLQKLQRLNELPLDHKAIKDFAIKRKIPRDFWYKLYYTNNYKAWINNNIEPNKFDAKSLFKEDERIVIPFYNSDGKFYAVAGRYIGSDEFKLKDQRYLTINQNKDNLLVYGLDSIDFTKPTYVTEGQIDSFHVINCLAAAGSSLLKLLEYKDVDFIFCFDNESRSKQICNIMQKTIDTGHKIIIWDNYYDAMKDINDLFTKYEFTQEKLMKYLESRTFQGLLAQIEFNKWKKVS